MVYKWLNIVHAAWPARCLLCAGTAPRGRDLCGDCAADLPTNGYACQRCALPLGGGGGLSGECGGCRSRPPPFDALVAPYRYAPPLHTLIAELKFGGRLAAGRVMADLLADALVDRVVPDLIVPLPLHPRRLARRGFNQAAELAARLSRRLDCPAAFAGLQRRRDTSAQAALDRRARRRNLAGAFVWAGERPPPARVALVDDVVTTGSTASAAARALRRAGANWIEVWAVARTPDRRSDG
jgi:ComF family protein